MRHFYLVLLVGFVSWNSWATHGTNLIGISPASQALGGTGVANETNPTDSISKNPAFLVDPKATEGKIEAQATFAVFNQVASSENTGLGAKDSSEKSVYAPSLSALYQVGDSLAFGLGVHSIGGALANYSSEASLVKLQTSKKLLRILPTVAYQAGDGISIGISPIVLMSSFQLNANGSTTPSQTRTGYGVLVGAKAQVSDNLIFGATYTSKQKVLYRGLIDVDSFGPAGVTKPDRDDVTLEQPQEIALGATYLVSPEFLVTFDYRNLNWSSADGYSQLGWASQNVFALGVQYRLDKLTFRGGYNYAKSPFSDVSGENGLEQVDFQGHPIFKKSVSVLNMIAFPALVESHFTAGLGYEVTSDLGLDVGLVYAPKVTRSRSGTAGAAYQLTSSVSQWALSVGGTFQF